MTTNISGCDLHIPHKDWADDPKEAQNYQEIERWALRLQSCFGGGCACYESLWHDKATIPNNTRSAFTQGGAFGTYKKVCGTRPDAGNRLWAVAHRWDLNGAGNRYCWALMWQTYGATQQVIAGQSGPGLATGPALYGNALTGPQGQVQSYSFTANSGEVPNFEVWQDSGGPLDCDFWLYEYVQCCECLGVGGC